MKISEIRNPQDFQDLCQSLLCAEYNDTQIVRDSNGDGGIDAYVPSTRTLYAMYCPENHRTPKDYYKRKIKSDLAKAAKLRDEKGYRIRRWVFLTPGPLEEELHRYLHDKVIEFGFEDGANQAELHLQNLLLKHSHLRPQFSQLILPDLESILNEIQAALKGNVALRTPADEFSYYTRRALRRIRNQLSGLDYSHLRPEAALIEEQWRLGKPVLLSGESGTGKSGIAAILATQARKPVLLLDARSIAQLVDELSLRRYFDLTAPLSQTIAGLAQDNGFRLIIDQLDNLIGKESADLIVNLALECAEAKGVEVIVISRNKEAYEARLARRLTDAGFVPIQSRELREADVMAVLAMLGINTPTKELVRLGQNLLNLEIICMIRRERLDFDFSMIGSEVALWEQYLIILQEREPLEDGIGLGELLTVRATELARASLQNGKLTFALNPPITPVERRLISWGIIVRQEGRFHRFGHEKLQDYLYARYMCEEGSLPIVVKAEVWHHHLRNILPLMDAIYTAGTSAFLIPFLREVLISGEIPFFSQAAVLERYIHSPNPVENLDALAIVIEALRKKPELRRWFFANRLDPRWAEILLEHGFLNEPPELIVEDGVFFLPRWDVQDYLVSVASEVPDVVLAHFERIRGNRNYLRGALKALCLISMEQVCRVVPRLLDCISDPITAFKISEEVFALTKNLARSGLADSAFALFEALTNPQPSSQARKSNIEGLGDYVTNGEAVSLLPTDNYRADHLWNPVLEELAGLDIKRLVVLLENQLIQALRLEAETEGRSDEAYGVSFWRRAIEDTGQDLSRDYKSFLLQCLRDFLEKLCKKQPDEAAVIIDDYLSRDYVILRRLSIYLLWQFPQQHLDRVRDILLNAENMDEGGIHHEYFKLLEHGYPYLELADKRRLEEMILSGPRPEKLAEVATWAKVDRGEDPEEYSRSYTKHWRQKRLWMIRNHLQGEAAVELQKLTAELGEPDHPDFTSWISGGHFISPVSPVDEDEIRAMPLEELFRYLREWKPRYRWPRLEEESHGLLGQVVARVVFSDYKKYSGHLDAIARFNSAYATSFINHAPNDAISPDETLRIKLSLSEELLTDRTIRNDDNHNYEGGWIGFRSAVVNYLEKLFEHGLSPIPVAELSRIRDLLIFLTDDPDPSPDADQPAEEWFGHKDPATVAINHVRPRALNALILYADHKARLDKADDRHGFGPKRLEPEVEQTLTRKVNYHLDGSTALHSVFGKQFNLLCWLDWNWAVERLNEIFRESDDEMSIRFFAAAWDSFVIFNSKIYQEIFALLQAKYERAIELHKRGFNTETYLDPVSHFASHLVVVYLYADYSLNSPEGQSSFLVRFFNETAPSSRATAAYSAVNVFINASKRERNVGRFWPRIRALWQWRLEEAAGRNHPADFDGEMQSFSRLLRSAAKRESAASFWPLLEGMLHYIAHAQRGDIVWRNFEKYLMLEIRRDPVKAIQVFRLMHDQLEAQHYYYSDEARRIIETGVRRAESRHETLLLIEQITRSGNHSFTHIYDQYANDLSLSPFGQ